jgi:xanthine dehydrogenase molybdenum-binding subunit
VEYRPGTGCVMKSDPERVLTVADICQQMNETGGPISAVGNINTRGWQPAFAVHVVDVEVDPETGKVTVFRYTASQDVGRAIHPSYVEGQIQGGVVQGIGWALLEEYVFDEKGILRNPNLLDYRVPTTLDVPMIETILVEVPNTFHPLGVKGVGEVNIVPPAGALANALYRATGVRFTELPMKAERVALTLASAAAD